ncbi:hypothetical protein EVAR_92976_1 [Eumeta japonica]|uniref:Uncharacterized protein n=1 Tax=Eumeta variegata TaxID=151549 RepID=A0A4C1TDG2_EUMVA|nr:hypothetical protein EVAR_92976_1 [Eumeta japonica]
MSFSAIDPFLKPDEEGESDKSYEHSNGVKSGSESDIESGTGTDRHRTRRKPRSCTVTSRGGRLRPAAGGFHKSPLREAQT